MNELPVSPPLGSSNRPKNGIKASTCFREMSHPGRQEKMSFFVWIYIPLCSSFTICVLARVVFTTLFGWLISTVQHFISST